MFCITAFDLFFSVVTESDRYIATAGEEYYNVRGDDKAVKNLLTKVYPDLVWCQDSSCNRYLFRKEVIERLREEFLMIDLLPNAPNLSGKLSCFIVGPGVSAGWNTMPYNQVLQLMMHYVHKGKRADCCCFLCTDNVRDKQPSAFIRVQDDEAHIFFGDECIRLFDAMRTNYASEWFMNCLMGG